MAGIIVILQGIMRCAHWFTSTCFVCEHYLRHYALMITASMLGGGTWLLYILIVYKHNVPAPYTP